MSEPSSINSAPVKRGWTTSCPSTSASVTAAFTAIVTNYLLRARLGQPLCDPVAIAARLDQVHVGEFADAGDRRTLDALATDVRDEVRLDLRQCREQSFGHDGIVAAEMQIGEVRDSPHGTITCSERGAAAVRELSKGVSAFRCSRKRGGARCRIGAGAPPHTVAGRDGRMSEIAIPMRSRACL